MKKPKSNKFVVFLDCLSSKDHLSANLANLRKITQLPFKNSTLRATLAYSLPRLVKLKFS